MLYKYCMKYLYGKIYFPLKLLRFIAAIIYMAFCYQEDLSNAVPAALLITTYP